MLGAQIAVAVDQLVLQHAFAQRGGLRVERHVQPVERWGRVGEGEAFLQQYFAVACLLAAKAGEVVIGAEASARSASVKGCQHVDQRVDVCARHAALADRAVERALGRQALHQHQPVDGAARRRQVCLGHEPETPVVPLQRDEPEIDLRRQPPVQPQFLARVTFARRHGREIEEGGAHRLLQFQRAFAGEYHPGHVRLDRLDRPADTRVRGARAQEAQLGLRVWRRRVAVQPMVHARHSSTRRTMQG